MQAIIIHSTHCAASRALVAALGAREDVTLLDLYDPEHGTEARAYAPTALPCVIVVRSDASAFCRFEGDQVSAATIGALLDSPAAAVRNPLAVGQTGVPIIFEAVAPNPTASSFLGITVNGEAYDTGAPVRFEAGLARFAVMFEAAGVYQLAVDGGPAITVAIETALPMAPPPDGWPPAP